MLYCVRLEPQHQCGECHGGTLGSYSRMANALNSTGRPIVLSIEGAPPIATVSSGGYGNLRRVGHDIRPNWYSVVSEIDLSSGLHPYAHNGSLSKVPGSGGFW